MNKEYATEVLEMVEAGTLERDSSLAKEAFRYLKRLKSSDYYLLSRIDKLENK